MSSQTGVADWERDPDRKKSCDCCAALYCLAGQLRRQQIDGERAAAALHVLAKRCEILTKKAA